MINLFLLTMVGILAFTFFVKDETIYQFLCVATLLFLFAVHFYVLAKVDSYQGLISCQAIGGQVIEDCDIGSYNQAIKLSYKPTFADKVEKIIKHEN